MGSCYYKNENSGKIIYDGIRDFCVLEGADEEHMRLLIERSRGGRGTVKTGRTYLIMAIFMVLCAVCISVMKNKDPIDKIGFVIEDIDVPGTVLDAAKTQVKQLFEINAADYPDHNYINWRIANLTYACTYDDLNGMRLAIFQMNYELLSASPENIVLAGGMYITVDNWVMPGYPNSTYLIFQQNGDKLTFLRSIVENDCTPGDQLFTEDLLRILT
jgi:hypothetical protein